MSRGSRRGPLSKRQLRRLSRIHRRDPGNWGTGCIGCESFRLIRMRSNYRRKRSGWEAVTPEQFIAALTIPGCVPPSVVEVDGVTTLHWIAGSLSIVIELEGDEMFGYAQGLGDDYASSLSSDIDEESLDWCRAQVLSLSSHVERINPDWAETFPWGEGPYGPRQDSQEE